MSKSSVLAREFHLFSCIAAIGMTCRCSWSVFDGIFSSKVFRSQVGFI